MVHLVEANSSGVVGTLVLKKTHLHGQPAVRITGEIYGLSAGEHGFHVHAGWGTGNDCQDAKGHFNPFGVGTPNFIFTFYL